MDEQELQPYLKLYASGEAVHPLEGPCFICEGRYLVEAALEDAQAGRLRLLSLLCAPAQAERWRERAPGVQLLVRSEAELEGLLGFAFHRGVLACVACPPEGPLEDLYSARKLLVLPRLDDQENLGLLLRSAAALGMDAVLLGRGPGRFHRRTVRVSMGAAWRLPVFQREDPLPLLEAWRAREAGAQVVAAALVEEAVPLGAWAPPARCALLLGPEGPGLDARWVAAADRCLAIPMKRRMDSLNVAAAGAVFMAKLCGAC